MHVTPGDGERALIVALHGAGGTPSGAIEAFSGAWDEPGLVLIAPASKGQTWSILRSEQDLDLESVNLALAEAYERCTIDRRRIAVGGFSDGATYALTLGVSNGDLFPAVIAFSPGRDRRRRAAGRPALLRLARHARQRPSDRAGGRRRRPQAPPGRLPGHLPPLPRRPRGLAGHLESRRPLVPRRRAGLAAPRALVERDRPGDGDVERLGCAARRDRGDMVARIDELLRQPVALRSEQERRRPGELELVQRRRAVGDERDARRRERRRRPAAGRGRSRRPMRAAPSGRAGRRSPRRARPRRRTRRPRAAACRRCRDRRCARARGSSRAAPAAAPRCGRPRRRAPGAPGSRPPRAGRARRSRRRRAARSARSRPRSPPRSGPRPRRRRVRAPRACASARGACGRASASDSTPR